MWLLHAIYACSPVSPQGHWENHIKDVHGGMFMEEQLTDVESAELVTKL